ncbi:uncharacterized protein K444DRAFT_633113 [Hyaloscypha bicolor E]|uniref:Invertebrate defensins family profile domain-containing protein n=1 Tax=Hyaloscypha bicolor E TaxID=1095630 RepID=A0A2J6SZA0_9HELO|nr:uncharacterized protein K444DRAFT_633113 [Hyaloscypha bicolor E]PMD56095.1 hypothetical protein K444DRAFT_633113 [Hyaloscypha bicolor E]
MKLTHFLSFAALALAVQAEVSWYVGSRNITCKGHDDGHIDCAQGHDGGAPEVQLDHPSPSTTPVAIRGRDAAIVPGLQKRVTCNIDGVTKGLACFTHCFAIGYCNSHCDSNNICRCTCLDETPWWNPIVCSKTSCA